MTYLLHVIILLYHIIRRLEEDYTGYHRDGRVSPVHVTYHPLDSTWRHLELPYNELWRERMLLEDSGEWHPFTMPLRDLARYREKQYQAAQTALKITMGNYGWLNYPIDQWPLEWQIAGSDLPARGSELPQWT